MQSGGTARTREPMCLPKSIRIGTSAFMARGWEGTFYPAGMKPSEYLSYYATQFDAVELDNTFYATPSLSTVKGWYEKTPPGFLFAAKVPQVITHEKVLVDCEDDLKQFLETMEALGEKLGPLLFQFGYFHSGKFKSGAEFLARLKPFLQRLPKGFQYAVEIRNKYWLDAQFAETLRENGVALALIDHSWMPRPWEMKGKVDVITADFTYVRWLGDRKDIEEQTAKWDKAIVDRGPELLEWVRIFQFMAARGIKVFAWANNHYAGHAPATVKLFCDIWKRTLAAPTEPEQIPTGQDGEF
jgi:uncharacterized protein YecE (DUF72 family)